MPLALLLLPDTFAICRLNPDAPIPEWANTDNFSSITRTRDELSIVCLEHTVPAGTVCEKGWRCLRVKGKLVFPETGVLASLATPLAQADVSIFVVSTYDTDYLLVKQENLHRAMNALTEAGHHIQTE